MQQPVSGYNWNYDTFILLPGTKNAKEGMQIEEHTPERDSLTERDSFSERDSLTDVISAPASRKQSPVLSATASEWEPTPATMVLTPSVKMSSKQTEEKEAPALCKYGQSCVRNGCTFVHSARPSSVRVCRYDIHCSRGDCHFTHPNGRTHVQPVNRMNIDVPKMPIPKIGFGKIEDSVIENMLLAQMNAQRYHVPQSQVVPAVRHRVRILD